MKTKTMTLIASAATLFAAVTWAGTGDKPANDGDSAPPSFSQLDKNHDGRITRREIPHSMHKLRRHFHEYDRDGNGWLSEREYQAFEHPVQQRKVM